MTSTTPALNRTSATHINHRLAQIGARAVWVGVLCVCIGLLVAALPARFEQLRTPGSLHLYQITIEEAALMAEYNVSLEIYALYNLIFEVIQVGVFLLVAGVLFAKRSDDYVALFVSITLIVIGVLSPAPVHALAQGGQPPALVSGLHLLRYIFTIIFLYVYPDGRFVPTWTRAAAVVWSLATVLLTTQIGSPEQWPDVLQGILAVAWLAPGVAAQAYRFRFISTSEQQQQTRWFLYGLTLVLVVTVVRSLVSGFAPLTEPGSLRLLYYTLLSVPIFDTAAFIVLPVTIGVAIARYRLYGLTLVINRSLVYAAMLLTLFVVFLVVFFMIQGVFQLVGGSPSLALVIATAVTAAAFNPARQRARHFIDVYFFGLRADLAQIRAAQTSQPAPFDLAPGAALGGYTLIGRIGRGGMGEVYRAQHTRLNRTVAIKVLAPQLMHEAAFRARFEREAQTVAALKHPNIVEVFDFGQDAHTVYMVMEFINGQTLADVLRAQGRLSLADTQAVVRGIAAALDYAHARGIVHRDVKPANVMLRAAPLRTPDAQGHIPILPGDVVLMDFGITKIQDSTLTHAGMIGTVEYAAPEQIMSAGTVDHRADIYALGGLAYRLMTGALPFRGSLGEQLFAHLHQPAPDPRLLRPDWPDDAALAIVRALAKDPAQRYNSAGEFSLALLAC